LPGRIANLPGDAIVSHVLKDWLSEEALAKELDKSVRTLRQWRKKKVGPPYSLFGRTVRYHGPTVVEHFKAREIKPVRSKPAGGSRSAETP
jgi:hypothetical protein